MRFSLLAVLAGLVASAAAIGGNGTHAAASLVGGSGGVVVVDVSKSITDAELAATGAVLRKVISSSSRAGLVFFSDVSYELLPPEAPTSALRPFVRFFTPIRGRFPRNPWDATFRAGTVISKALRLASDMLAAENIRRGSIVLVSDLQTASSDYTQLSQTLASLRADGVQVRAISLYPNSLARQLFASILGPKFLLPVPHDSRAGGRPEPGVAGAPVALLVLGGLLLLAVGANEWWGGRLGLPAGELA